MISTLENAQKLIFKNFTFLEKMGYIPKVKVDSSPIFIESIDVEYQNDAKRRTVSINYNKSKVNDKIQYTFVVSIMRIPCMDVTKDFFSLWVYLDRMGIDFSTKLVNHYDEEGADCILKNIVNSVNAHAEKIIEGSEWKEGYYAPW